MNILFLEKLKDAQKVLKDKNIELRFRFNPPAKQDEIQKCEKDLGFTLPMSYKEFLKFSNGANLFCSDQKRSETSQPTSSWYADSGILIQSTSSIVEFNREHDKIYLEDDGTKKYIAFCYLGYICTGDFCSFDVTDYVDSEYRVLDCDHDYSFDDWHADHVIADSFEDWLIKLFDEVIQNNHRPEYWLPSPL